MENKENNIRSAGRGRLFLKSALWTLIALSLIFIGYFGAEVMFGGIG